MQRLFIIVLFLTSFHVQGAEPKAFPTKTGDCNICHKPIEDEMQLRPEQYRDITHLTCEHRDSTHEKCAQAYLLVSPQQLCPIAGCGVRGRLKIDKLLPAQQRKLTENAFALLTTPPRKIIPFEFVSLFNRNLTTSPLFSFNPLLHLEQEAQVTVVDGFGNNAQLPLVVLSRLVLFAQRKQGVLGDLNPAIFPPLGNDAIRQMVTYFKMHGDNLHYLGQKLDDWKGQRELVKAFEPVVRNILASDQPETVVTPIEKLNPKVVKDGGFGVLCCRLASLLQTYQYCSVVALDVPCTNTPPLNLHGGVSAGGLCFLGQPAITRTIERFGAEPELLKDQAAAQPEADENVLDIFTNYTQAELEDEIAQVAAQGHNRDLAQILGLTTLLSKKQVSLDLTTRTINFMSLAISLGRNPTARELKHFKEKEPTSEEEKLKILQARKHERKTLGPLSAEQELDYTFTTAFMIEHGRKPTPVELENYKARVTK